MIAGIYNITCEQGSTFTRTFTINNPDETPFNLTGYSARMQIRRDVDSSTVILSATNDNGAIAITAGTGVIVVTLSATQTAALTRGGIYDLEIFHSNGTVFKVVKGLFRLDKEVTR